MKVIKILIISILCVNIAIAQEPEQWTLQECIDYALENNLSIKRSALNVETSELNLIQSQYSRTPSVNANGSYAWSWGRSIDPTTNLFVDNQQIVSSNASVNASVVLFNGLNIHNSVKQNQFALKSNELTLEDTKNNVTFNVITLYTNVLFTRELWLNATKQLESTNQQVGLTEKRVNAGALPKSSLLDLLAQQATNELNKVNRENDYLNAKVQLKQALQLPPETSVEIVVPDMEASITPVLDFTALDVYNIAINNQPNIKAAQLNKESAEYGVMSQKGNYYPTLTLNAGISTQFSDASKRVTSSDTVTFSDPVLTNGNDAVVYRTTYFDYGTGIQSFNDPLLTATGFETIPLSTQYNDNLRKYVSLNLSIPIFNGFSARNNVQRAKITQLQAELTEQETKYQLWQTIEQAYNNVQAAGKSYGSSIKQVEAREESFRVTKQRYDLGAVNYVDYQVAENDLFQAKSDLLRAKYDYIFKLKVLDFYQGKSLEF